MVRKKKEAGAGAPRLTRVVKEVAAAAAAAIEGDGLMRMSARCGYGEEEEEICCLVAGEWGGVAVLRTDR
jgi:hypothetical protein